MVDTPDAPTLAAMKQTWPTKLRDVLHRWKARKKRKPRTGKVAEAALGPYKKATGDSSIGTRRRTDQKMLFDRLQIMRRVLHVVDGARKQERGRRVPMRAFGNLTLRVLGVATAGSLIYFD